MGSRHELSRKDVWDQASRITLQQLWRSWLDGSRQELKLPVDSRTAIDLKFGWDNEDDFKSVLECGCSRS